MVGLTDIKQGVHMLLVVGNIALEQVSVRALRYSVASYSSNAPFSSVMGDGTIDAFEAAVPRNSSSHHIYK
jgi:hypothetical protein